MKETIKKMVRDISSAYSDELVGYIIEEATNEVKALRRSEDVKAYAYLIGRMVRYKLNTIGKEGVNSENYTAASFAYTSDYPEDILRELRRIKKVVFL